MVDVINLRHPGGHSDMQAQLEKVRGEVLERLNKQLLDDIGAIYDGIRRGDQVELTYPDGEVILITKARPRTGKEPS